MPDPNVILINPTAKPYLMHALPIENVRLGSIVAAMRTILPSLQFLDADMEGLDIDAIIEVIRAAKSTVVIIYLMYRNLSVGMDLARAIRYMPHPPLIIAFGHAATLSADDLLTQDQSIDAIITGEPMATLIDLSRAWQHRESWQGLLGIAMRSPEGCLIRTPPRPLMTDIDQLPLPARDYLQISLQHSPVVEVLTSYGCYAHCTFCNVPVLIGESKGPRWRGHSPEYIIDELTNLWTHYGVRHVEFVDDNFLGPGEAGYERAKAIALGIIAKGLHLTFRIYCRADDIDLELFSLLKAAGLQTVHFGIETASSRLLNRFDKHVTLDRMEKALTLLRQLEIKAVPSFIMFEPTMTLEELHQNLAFLSEYDLPHLISPTGIIPFQGTHLTKLLKTESLLSVDQFIVPNYIPAVRFMDKRVALIKAWWEQWQVAVDEHFGMMLTNLTRSFYANPEVQTHSDTNWAILAEMFQALKWHERDEVILRITELAENISTPNSLTLDPAIIVDDNVLDKIYQKTNIILRL